MGDKIRFFCLIVLTLFCIGSLFTSQSISMMNPSMRVARDERKFCMEPRKAAMNCERKTNDGPSGTSKTSEDCSSLQKSVQMCERVVQKAFRYINMAGCSKQLQLLAQCEDEWCHQDPKSCQKECAGVRKSLSVCVQENVIHYFKRNGLKENGTIG